MSRVASGPPPPAVLFDVDGTLVDSNYLHLHAWCRAFAEAGLAVETWRVHRSIGMDGAELVRTLSDDAPDDVQDRLKGLHDSHYRETVHLLVPLKGAQEPLQRVAALGLQVVLATSASEHELAILRKVLDSEDVISEVTSSQDVDTAKPEPDIVQVALDRAGVTAAAAVLVGRRHLGRAGRGPGGGPLHRAAQRRRRGIRAAARWRRSGVRQSEGPTRSSRRDSDSGPESDRIAPLAAAYR